MEKQTGHYTSKELLQNDSFLRWKLFQSEDDRIFWEKYLQENPEMFIRIEEAGQIARTIVRLNHYTLTEDESLLISQAIQNRLQKQQRRKRISLLVTSVAAACAVIFFFLSLPFAKDEGEKETGLIVQSQPEKAEESKDILMIIDNNESLRLEQNADIKYDEAGNIVVLNDNKEVTRIETKDKPIQKNKLIVPKGKHSSLVLADGTKVWINSGSTIEFPHSFETEKREITVDGEIYIEVARDEDKPFIVNTSEVAVKVLGTRFNISSYKEDDFSNVVLVEGKVEVSYENEKIILKPDQLALLKDKSIEVKTVNVYDYISWKDGLLQFNSESLSLILTRISRYYDVNISYSENMQDLTCTGKLVLFDDISQVLKTIANTVPIRFEIINDNEILISKK